MIKTIDLPLKIILIHKLFDQFSATPHNPPNHSFQYSQVFIHCIEEPILKIQWEALVHKEKNPLPKDKNNKCLRC